MKFKYLIMIIIYHTYEIRKSYIAVFYFYILVTTMEKNLNVIEQIAALSNLSKTDVEILIALYKKSQLLVSEIANNIKRSERHIRQRLQTLYKQGFLKRKIEILKNKRIAYRYSLIPFQKVTIELRKKMQKKIDEIEKLIIESKNEV